MPCDSSLRGLTLAERTAQITAALKRLETSLSAGRTRVTIGANGAVAFTGWDAKEREGVSDVCAYRSLTAQSSFALRTAIARAEAQSGRKVNPVAVAAGVHSHDGGGTWHPGHK